MPIINKKIIPHLFLIFAITCWGSMYIFIKQIAGFVHPLNIALARFVIATILFLPFIIKKIVRIEKKDWLFLTTVSMFNGAVATAINVWATKLSIASNVSVIVNVNPLIIMALSPFLIAEKTNWKMKLGMIIGFIGLYIVIFQGFSWHSIISSKYLLGNVLALVGATIIAITVIYQQKYIIKYDPITITSIVFLSSAVLLFIITATTGTLWQFSLNTKSIVNLMGLGALATVIPFVLFNYGLQWIGVNRAAVYKMLIPVSTALLAIIFLREQLTIYTIAGLICTMTGIYLVNNKGVINS